MKLATILIISLVLVGIVGSIGGTYYFYLQSNEILEQSVAAHLETAAVSRSHHIDTFLSEQKEKIEMIASSFIFKKLFDENLENYEETLESACARLKKIVELDEIIYELFILDIDGKIICSSSEENGGLDRSEDDYFVEGLKGTYIKDAYYSETTGKNSLAFSTPIVCDDTGCLGVMVARAETSILNKITEDRGGLGESGEIYLINKEGYMITDSKFEQDTFLKKKIDSVNALNCLSTLKSEGVTIHEGDGHMGHETVEIYLDYQGVRVLGSHHHSHLIDWCLLAEIDEAEALGVHRRELLRVSIIILISLVIFVTLVGFIISCFISKPIRKLTNSVDEVTKGKLDVQLPKSKIFEVQRLTDSLNRILASLKLAILKTGSVAGLGLGEVVEAKEEAEEKYKTLYESSRDAIMVLEPPTWNFTAGNPATVKMFGAKDEEDFISRNPGELSPEKQPDGKLSSEKFKEVIMKAMKEGSNSFEWTHKRISGEEFPAQILLTKMKLKGKDVLQATVRDVTGEKEAEKRFKYLTEASFEGIMIHSAGKFIFANEQFCKMFGYECNELIGKNVATLLIAPESRKLVGEKIRAKDLGPYEAWGVRKDGSKFLMEIKARESVYGGKPVRIAVMREVNSKDIMEKAIIKKVPRPAIKKTIPSVKKTGSLEKKLRARADEINKKRINRALGKK